MFNQYFTEQGPLTSFFLGNFSAFIISWLTYRFVKRREMLDNVRIVEEREKRERIRQEVTSWANPILLTVIDLKGRLKNILDYEGYLALSKNCNEQVNPNWAISYDYFMNSTIFLFGQYFAWIQMLKNKLNFELFESQKEKDDFFKAIRLVEGALGRFPQEEHCAGKDTQVFRLQQKVIGELFTVTSESDKYHCINYSDFLKKLDDPNFTYHLEPLKLLIEDVRPGMDCRWKRLEATRQALIILEGQCNKLLSISNEA
ncbi:hypothetical protein MSSIT_1601 [Methanosarcina siciliae T4/M]|uniref:Uncharacterized protein n=1 Tax=Methanosarcina siciliae T4/M TaxID=1434120 RepID=A0A0E3P433_9EURY|nr:hypothetical protein [Methanosarcina siciliae]AKB28320.1 hypothetical protein MSSIT_1601 [Methanosarcina siciliae T4/M]